MDTSSSERRLRVLFVCALNQWRSPTAEHLYRTDARLQVRSAGIRVGAKRQLSEADLFWVDIVFVMEREQKRAIIAKFRNMELPRIEDLDIPDEYEYMDPRLQEALRLAIEPEIEAIISSSENSA